VGASGLASAEVGWDGRIETMDPMAGEGLMCESFNTDPTWVRPSYLRIDAG
jgi:hypothetical protein